MNWDLIKKDETVADVFVLNMDLSDSTKLALRSHPGEYQKKINRLQQKIEGLFSKDMRFYRDRWSGDGFVVLFKEKKDYADDLINKGMKILDLIKDENGKSNFQSPIGIRIGINIGNIRFNKDIGKILGNTMNRAGHLQKHCPDEGGILVRGKVENYVKDKDLFKGFSLKTVYIKGERSNCYYYPLYPEQKIPDVIGYREKVTINVEELYGEKALVEKRNSYVTSALKKAGSSKEVILTGKGPVWVYLLIAKALHGKVSRLVYSSPTSGDIMIFDNLPYSTVIKESA